MEKNHNKFNDSLLPLTKNSNSLQNYLNSTQFLAEWTQRELTNHISDIVIHFLLSFSSIHTKRSYLYDIKEFINFANDIDIQIQFVSQIDEKILIQWHDSLNAKKNLTQKSIRRKLNSISSLLEFCRKRKLIENNPMHFINKPKVVEESSTNAFTIDEVKQILSYLKNETQRLSQENKQSRSYKSSLLNYTIMTTLFSVGMRVNELCELKIKDVEFSAEITRLHMTAKGNKEHAPIIHEKTAILIKEYMKMTRLCAKEQDYLFVRAQNVRYEKKLSQVAIYKIVTETAKKVGIDKKVSPHSCRASLATILHNQGVPIGQIQNLLNHKEISTTSIYIKKANELEESAAIKMDLSKFNIPKT